MRHYCYPITKGIVVRYPNVHTRNFKFESHWVNILVAIRNRIGNDYEDIPAT